jgi:nitrogen-specific signal transduction histidine kinase
VLAIGVTYVLSASVTFALAVYVALRGDEDRSLQLFGILLVGIIVWSLAMTGRLFTASVGGKMLWQLVGYLGILAIPPAFLLFVTAHTGRGQYVSLPSIALLSIEPGTVLALILTNDAHMLFYGTVSLTTVGDWPVLTTTGGPAFWAHTLYSYVLVGLAILILVSFAVTTERLYRVQVVALVSGALVPVVANALFVLGMSPNPTFDLTPTVFALSSLLIFVGVVYGRFSHLRPVDRETVLSAVEDGILVVDDTDRVIYANPAAKQIMPDRLRKTGRLVGEPLSAVLPVVTTDRPGGKSTTDSTEGFEASLLRDGEMRWFWIRQVQLEADPNGSTVVILADISDRKARQRRSEQIQRSTWQLMDVADREQVAEIAVETASEVFSLPLSAIYLQADEGDRLRRIAATAGASEAFGSNSHFERDEQDGVARLAWQAYVAEETTVLPDVSGADAFDGSGTPVRSAIVQPIPEHGVLVLSAREVAAVDETDVPLIEILSSSVKGALDQAESRRALRENEARLQRQNERLEEFTSVVSHDLRSPLNTANGYLELVADEYDDERVGRIQDALGRMETLVGDLLTLARQGKTVDETTETVLAETAWRGWESIPASDGSLTVDGELGQAAVDASRLRQAFENLFRNAVEHAGDDVAIRVGRLEDACGFYVEDDGPGIPADERERVFEHGYSSSEGGTGLGLAIVKRIFEAHGWSVRATEGQHGGARFEVTGVELRRTRVEADSRRD